MDKNLLLVSAIGIVALGLIVGYVLGSDNNSDVNSFEECVAAGNLIMDSYPPQCQTSDGKTFTQNLPSWKTDDVTLMRVPQTGELSCFGCGATICIDPTPGLEIIEETESQHCNENMEVVSS